MKENKNYLQNYYLNSIKRQAQTSSEVAQSENKTHRVQNKKKIEEKPSLFYSVNEALKRSIKIYESRDSSRTNGTNRFFNRSVHVESNPLTSHYQTRPRKLDQKDARTSQNLVRNKFLL